MTNWLAQVDWSVTVLYVAMFAVLVYLVADHRRRDLLWDEDEADKNETPLPALRAAEPLAVDLGKPELRAKTVDVIHIDSNTQKFLWAEQVYELVTAEPFGAGGGGVSFICRRLKDLKGAKVVRDA